MSDIDGLRNRRSISIFNDVVPDKNIIDKIISDSIEFTPNKCSIPYHKVRVFGPEYKEDKEKLVIQTNCDPKLIEAVDSQEKIDKITTKWKGWFSMYRRDKWTKLDIKEEYGDYDFNPQVLAPYLFIFYDNHQDKSDFDQTHLNLQAKGSYYRALQSSAIHAYNIACFAAEHGISSSFLGNISIDTKFNSNTIMNNINFNDIVLILSLGYPAKSKWNPKHRQKFNVNDIIEWQNEIQN